ncbi:antitermination protein [Providencia rettgeri]|uniref:antitermination protein n=1 Tax=Providencia rettgeri TaxID=587 RepID=UPI0018E46C3E|nr:antitermination protein [Providencia rettgeri]MBI6191814.1 antitermination protein [Providencia rettgeri]UPQ40675.1 antitermination protein [Providencia rettgeri]
MKLENALKNFHPKSPTFSDSASCTSPDRLTGTDIMAAMGMAESQAKFGMTAFLAKNDVSEKDKFSTVEVLTQYAKKHTPKLVVKAAGNKLGYCLIILAKMAFEDYARSAGSVFSCSVCGGKGLIYSRKDVVKHPGIIKADGTVVIEPFVEKENIGELCKACNGKGQLTHRCRCKGRGKVLDEAQTELQGAPVYKDCPRCAGKGFNRVPSSIAFNAIKHLVPDLNERTWRRNWKPFYERLASKCFIEESIAEQAFGKVTK